MYHLAYCICNDQFLGVDCSVSIYTPPMITNIFGIEHGGRTWCNKANTNCKMSILFGYEIEQAPGITCKITKFLVSINMFMYSGRFRTLIVIFEQKCIHIFFPNFNVCTD